MAAAAPMQAVAAASLEGISKSFPGVVALDGVSFDVARGEIHALLGENGAGKSTLIKILEGLLQPDAGRIVLDGREVTRFTVRDARRRGITVIPQEILSVPELSVGRNILLGYEGRLTRREDFAPVADPSHFFICLAKKSRLRGQAISVLALS